MKKICLLFLFAWVSLAMVNAQTEEYNVPIAVYIPSSIEQPAVRSLLENKLSMIVSQNGMSDDQLNPRFIIYPKISVLATERTTTPPVLTLVELQVSFFIADYVDNKKFASTSFTVKGGGQSEERAYLDAVKKIRNNAEIEKCLSMGKQKIMDYYNQFCDKVLLEATELVKQEQFYESITTLYSIPMASDCFEKAQSIITEAYAQSLQYNCEQNLHEAEKYFATREIRKALEKLSLVENVCECREQANKLYDNILAYIQAKEKEAKEERDQERALQLEREIRDYNLILKSMDYAIQEVQKEREYIQYKRENNFYKQALKELYIEACKAKRSYSTTYITRKEQCITIIK